MRLPILTGAYFTLPWHLVPKELDGEIVVAKEGETITAARLIPVQMFISSEDFKAEDGTVLVPKGSELARAQSELLLACAMKRRKISFVKSLIALERYICFIDQDRDASFDKYFLVDTELTGILPGSNKVKTYDNLHGSARFLLADPTESKDSPNFELRYADFSPISGWIIFSNCVVSPSRSWYCAGLENRIGLKRNEVPGSFFNFGGEFRIIDKGDFGIKVEIVKQFDKKIVTFSY